MIDGLNLAAIFFVLFFNQGSESDVFFLDFAYFLKDNFKRILASSVLNLHTLISHVSNNHEVAFHLPVRVALAASANLSEISILEYQFGLLLVRSELGIF